MAMEIGTAYVKVVPVLDDDDLAAFRARINEAIDQATPAKFAPPDPLTIRLPDEMADGSERFVSVSYASEWREVFPGLQVRIDGAPLESVKDDSTETETTQTLAFRLAPQTRPGGC